MIDRPFWVLLGTDYAGKSSVLAELAADPTFTAISLDHGLLADGADPHGLIAVLRDRLLDPTFGGPDRSYSPDFVLSLLQAGVVFLRDSIRRADGRCVVVDSYYYKILAKCRLAGVVNEALFSWWRSFPKPRGVVFLHVDSTTAWIRGRNGADVHRYERYGDDRSSSSFDRYQRELHRALLWEVRDLPVYVVAASNGLAATTAAVRRLVEAG